jgi:phosphatidylserine/phosphatidylglycerophosphate/cardiolipin synthase-like enzyme
MSPNPTLRQTTVLATTLLLALLLVTAVGLTLAHSGGSPAWYFTDNLDATGPGEEITEMEQALLDRLNGAAGSIDAAIYDFNRNSVRDALLDAHGRGVTVRVVTDDDARNHSTYSLYYDALEAAGIPVIDDQRPGSLMHNKFFVFDEEIVWTGSTNLTNRGFTVNHNNSLVSDFHAAGRDLRSGVSADVCRQLQQRQESDPDHHPRLQRPPAPGLLLPARQRH